MIKAIIISGIIIVLIYYYFSSDRQNVDKSTQTETRKSKEVGTQWEDMTPPFDTSFLNDILEMEKAGELSRGFWKGFGKEKDKK